MNTITLYLIWFAFASIKRHQNRLKEKITLDPESTIYIFIHWVCKSLISLSIAAVFLVRSHRPYAKAGGWTEGAVSLGAMAEQWTIKVKIVSGLGLIPAHALLYFFCVVLNYGQLSAKIQSKASVLAFICTHAPTSSHDAKPWFVVCRHGQRSHQQQERHQVETWWWPHPADRGSRAPSCSQETHWGGLSEGYHMISLFYIYFILFCLCIIPRR